MGLVPDDDDDAAPLMLPCPFPHEDDVMQIVVAIAKDFDTTKIVKRSIMVLDAIIDSFKGDSSLMCNAHRGPWIKRRVPWPVFGNALMGPVVLKFLIKVLALVTLPADWQEFRKFVADFLCLMEADALDYNNKRRRLR